MSDPVAAKAVFLKSTVSPATLVDYAKWYGKADDVASAEMTAITSKNFTLACKLVNGAKKEIVIAFKPALKNYEEAEPRLLEMKALAAEGLGKAKPPKIRSFHLQRAGIPDGIFIMSIFPYLTLAPPDSTSRFFFPAHFVQSYVEPKHLGMVWAAGVGWHSLNALYTASLCWKHSIPTGASAAYIGMSLLTGFQTWIDLKKRIRDARIEAARKL
ncbi:hypothetical protein DFH06DRAFT_1211296, partial [Mycena polygramma]